MYSLTDNCQLLEGIGAISKANGQRAAACGNNYQDNVTIPLTCEHDNNTIAKDNPDGDIEVADTEVADGVLSGHIDKLQHID